MFTSIDAFKKVWEPHVQSTMNIMGNLTDEALNTSVAEGHRDLKRMAWHLVITIPEMANLTNLEVKAVAEDAPLPGTLAEILAGYKAVTDELFEQVTSKWTDESLHEEDDLYGQKWKRGVTLWSVVAHEIHHRGQMTVLMRQAGLKVPGVFGPAKEEWSQAGMATPEI